MWQRFKAYWHKSATIIWNAFCVGVLAVVSFLDQFIANEDVRNQLNTLLTPKVVAGIIVAISVGSILARLRTLGK